MLYLPSRSPALSKVSRRRPATSNRKNDALELCRSAPASVCRDEIMPTEAITVNTNVTIVPASIVGTSSIRNILNTYTIALYTANENRNRP